LKTLVLRVRRQNQTALKIATFLETHPRIEKVNYPGLESHPGHTIAREHFDGYGGMLSFEIVGGEDSARKFIEKLNIPINAVSLGGVESLVIQPALTAYVTTPPQERIALGISDGLIRFSVGIEDPEELLEDVNQALES
ncbi:MAG: PLP-dependent transferase, partial [Planctomycetota bacterium]|nr:PLP-dependent transferase [Planctomycetota bacterium]